MKLLSHSVSGAFLAADLVGDAAGGLLRAADFDEFADVRSLILLEIKDANSSPFKLMVSFESLAKIPVRSMKDTVVGQLPWEINIM